MCKDCLLLQGLKMLDTCFLRPSLWLRSSPSIHTVLGLGTHKNKWGNFWVKYWAFSQLHRLKTGTSTLLMVLFTSQHCPPNYFLLFFQYFFINPFFLLTHSCHLLLRTDHESQVIQTYQPCDMGKTLIFSGPIFFFFMQHLPQEFWEV